MKTLIFGGSFDPVHYGHLKMAARAKEKIKADRVIFMIARSPRWKETSASDDDRLNMLKLGLKGFDGFEISLLEYNSKDEINYTYNTILKYKKQKNEELYFLIGSDQLEKLNLWYEIEKLSKIVKFVVFKRPGYEINKSNLKEYGVKLIDIEISDMSSTALRFMNCLDTPKPILDYIAEHNLYYINVIKQYISEKRFKHSLSVANLCYEIALRNEYSPDTAYLTGLLHDIGKELPMDEQLKYIKENYSEVYGLIQKPLYHQFTSEAIAKDIFHINNEEILDAIKCHATGSSNMSKLAKILYAADKIDPLRGYDSSSMIQLCYEDIDKGFVEVLRENVKYFKEKGIAYDNPLTMSCIRSYLKEEC